MKHTLNSTIFELELKPTFQFRCLILYSSLNLLQIIQFHKPTNETDFTTHQIGNSKSNPEYCATIHNLQRIATLQFSGNGILDSQYNFHIQSLNERNFPRKQTKPNTYLRDLCNANLRSANLNSHVPKEKKKSQKESLETNSITNETNKKNGVLDLSLRKSYSNRS